MARASRGVTRIPGAARQCPLRTRLTILSKQITPQARGTDPVRERMQDCTPVPSRPHRQALPASSRETHPRQQDMNEGGSDLAPRHLNPFFFPVVAGDRFKLLPVLFEKSHLAPPFSRPPQSRTSPGGMQPVHKEPLQCEKAHRAGPNIHPNASGLAARDPGNPLRADTFFHFFEDPLRVFRRFRGLLKKRHGTFRKSRRRLPAAIASLPLSGTKVKPKAKDIPVSQTYGPGGKAVLRCASGSSGGRSPPRVPESIRCGRIRQCLGLLQQVFQEAQPRLPEIRAGQVHPHLLLEKAIRAV